MALALTTALAIFAPAMAALPAATDCSGESAIRTSLSNVATEEPVTAYEAVSLCRSATITAFVIISIITAGMSNMKLLVVLGRT